MLDVRRLDVSFCHSSSSNHAVRGASYSLFAGQTYGLAGESGCGKTTLATLLVGLLTPTIGTVRFRSPEGGTDGANWIDLARASRRE